MEAVKIGSHELMQIFALLFLVLGLFLWRAFRRWTADAERKNFDVADLWMENGRMSRQAIMLLGSWGSSTWAFVYVTLSVKFDVATMGPYTTFVLAYGGLWISPLVARIFKGDAPTPPPSTTPPAPDATTPKP